MDKGGQNILDWDTDVWESLLCLGDSWSDWPKYGAGDHGDSGGKLTGKEAARREKPVPDQEAWTLAPKPVVSVLLVHLLSVK